jgi:hypothetical protein
MARISAFVILLSATYAIALDTPKNIVLSKTSNVPRAEILKILQKGCPDVSITDDVAKGDYTLEAIDKTKAAGPYGDGPEAAFDLTLFDRDGKVLRNTTSSLAHVCAFLRSSVCNPLKAQGRFSVLEKV